MRFWRALVILVHLHISTPQPVTENVRSRIDFVECCPCPGTQAARNLARSSINDAVPEASEMRGVDDCPCRFRDADSQGAPSSLFPNAVRPLQNVNARSNNKENAKPLLHPEVGLASSVLETLREATDEEYNEALARDAARSAQGLDPTVPFLEEVSDTAKNIVTIIVNPKEAGNNDDFLSEASHVQEARCIPSLGTARNNLQMKAPVHDQPNLIKEIFGLPKPKGNALFHRNLMDMDANGAASEVHNSVISDSRKLQNLQLKKSPSLWTDKVDPTMKPKNIVPTFKLRDINMDNYNVPKKIPESNKNHHNMIPKITNLHISPSSLKDLLPIKPRSELNPVIPKLKPLFLLPTEVPKLKQSSLIPDLKNLFNLKDVELVPPVSNLNKASPFGNLFKKTTFLPEKREEDTVIPMASTMELNSCVKKPNFNDIKVSEKPNKSFDTEVHDVLPSSSNDDFVAVENPSSKSSSELSSGHVKGCGCGGFGSEMEKSKDRPRSSEELFVINSEENIAQSDEVESDEEVRPDSIEEPEAESNNGFSFKSEDFDREISSEIINNDPDNIVANTDHTNPIITEKDDNEVEPSLENQFESPINSEEENSSASKNEEESVANIKSIDDHTQTEDDELNPLSDLQNINEDNENNRCSNGDFNKPLQVSSSNDFPRDDEHDVINESAQGLPLEENDSVDSEKSSLNDEVLSRPEIDSDSVETVDNTEASTSFMPENPNSVDSSETEAKTTDILEGHSIESEEHNTQKTCISEMPLKSFSKETNSVSGINKIQEMNAAASESIPRISRYQPQSQFRTEPDRETSVERSDETDSDTSTIFPFSLDALSNLRPLLPLDIISQLFNTNKRATSDEEVSTGTSSNLMSSAASTLNSYKLPTLRDPEEIDLDIFQLKPMPLQPRSSSRKVPNINFNSFKARVPLPKSLELKPLKLESTIRNKGEVLGTSFKLGSNKKGAKFASRFKPKGINILGDSHNLPTANNLKNILQSSVQNILDPTPIDKISSLSENVRLNSENTVRNIHKSLGSALNEPNSLRGRKALGQNLAKPESLLQTISRNHEDMTDKLHAIHEDFTDRLTSFRESIIDKSEVPALRAPVIKGMLPKATHPDKLRWGSNLRQGSIFPLKASQTKNLKTPLRKTDLNKKTPRVKTHKMTNAASALRPQIVKQPTTANFERRLSDNQQQDFKGLTNIYNPSLSKYLFRPSVRPTLTRTPIKTKITISATEPTPMMQNVAKESRALTNMKPVTVIKTNTKPNKEANVLTKPLKQSSTVKNNNILSRSRPVSEIKSPSFLNKERKTPLRSEQRKTVQTPQMNSNDNLSKTLTLPRKTSLNNVPAPKKISLPKVDDTILNKMREAVRARFKNLRESNLNKDRLKVKSVSSVNNPGLDMARSASETVGAFAKPEPVRENTPYSCKMVCTKGES